MGLSNILLSILEFFIQFYPPHSIIHSFNKITKRINFILNHKIYKHPEKTFITQIALFKFLGVFGTPTLFSNFYSTFGIVEKTFCSITPTRSISSKNIRIFKKFYGKCPIKKNLKCLNIFHLYKWRWRGCTSSNNWTKGLK